MRRSAIIRYLGSWAVANAASFTVTLLFFRQGQIGEASIIFLSYLYLTQLVLGGAAGAAFLAAAVLLGVEGAYQRRAAPKPRTVIVFTVGTALVGFGWIWTLNGMQEKPHVLELFFALAMAFLASIISLRLPANSNSA